MIGGAIKIRGGGLFGEFISTLPSLLSSSSTKSSICGSGDC